MHRMKVMLALLLLAPCVSLAGAAGVGTFSIEQTTPGTGVGQFGIATLVMDNSWQPPADSVTLAISWDPAVIQYVSTDWKVGNSVAATPGGTSELTLQFADYTKKYPTGRVPIASINFKGLVAGQTTLGIRVDSVRSHVGISETEFTDLTVSALTTPGVFVVGQGGGVVTPVTTAPVGTTPMIVPTLTNVPTLTTGPNVTVTGTVTGVITTPITILTTVPITSPTGITTGVPTGAPLVPTQGGSGGSDEYTGVVTRTATVTATRTATVTATPTVGANATPTVGTGSAQTIAQIAQANPNLSTLVTALQTAGLVDVLNGAGPFTVFAPTNAAFDKLPAGTLQGLLANKTELTRILTYHVAAGKYTSGNLTATGVVKTVEGANVSVSVESGRVRVDGANVTQADIQASNGVIHVIDAVMIPPAPTATATQTAIATTPAAATTARTTVPVNTTATQAGADVLPLVAAGLAALALTAARRR